MKQFSSTHSRPKYIFRLLNSVRYTEFVRLRIISILSIYKIHVTTLVPHTYMHRQCKKVVKQVLNAYKCYIQYTYFNQKLFIANKCVRSSEVTSPRPSTLAMLTNHYVDYSIYLLFPVYMQITVVKPNVTNSGDSCCM